MNSMVDNSCEKQAYMSYSPNQSGNFDEFLMHFVYEKNDRRQNDTGGTKCSYSKPVSNEVISPFYVDNERDNGIHIKHRKNMASFIYYVSWKII